MLSILCNLLTAANKINGEIILSAARGRRSMYRKWIIPIWAALRNESEYVIEIHDTCCNGACLLNVDYPYWWRDVDDCSFALAGSGDKVASTIQTELLVSGHRTKEK